MKFSLDTFAVRVDATFGSLRDDGCVKPFKLNTDVVHFPGYRTEIQNDISIEPSPSLMTWKEVVDNDKALNSTDRWMEPSDASRQAFEEESEFDADDAVAIETIQPEYFKEEIQGLNPEVNVPS